jgi:hypothetical protein
MYPLQERVLSMIAAASIMRAILPQCMQAVIATGDSNSMCPLQGVPMTIDDRETHAYVCGAFTLLESRGHISLESRDSVVLPMPWQFVGIAYRL